MCCLLSLMALAGPRVAIIIWWLVDMSWFERMFDTVFWPIVGLIFAPWTLLFYTISMIGGQNVAGWDYVLIVIGILLDIFTYSGGAWRNRKRVPGYSS